MTQRTSVALVLTAAFLAASSYSARADVRADEKAKIEFAGMLGRMFNLFGGKSAREGVTSTVAVKGNRKATFNDQTGQIIDLSEEKIYDLDLKKKTYKVTTFAELRRKMEEARQKAQEEARKEEGKPQEKAAPARNEKEPQVEVDFDIKNTGQKKVVNGFDTHEGVVTITVREKGKTLEEGGGMVMTLDMWLAPTIKEMKEVADFDMKYAQKLYGPVYAGISADQMAAMQAMYPMVKDAMAKMRAEGGRIDGTPVLTVTTMDGVKSAEQVAADTKQAETQKKDDQPKSVGGLMGRLASKVAAKKMGGEEAGKTRATFMTSTTEVLKVVTAVTPEDVAVPAGFKENK